jgi:hypothetical protein
VTARLPEGMKEIFDAALPADAPGAWIRRAISADLPMVEPVDLAVDFAVALEGQIAAVDKIHEPARYCTAHLITDHDCGTGWKWRCFECRSHSRDVPCRTYLTTHPLWIEGIG